MTITVTGVEQHQAWTERRLPAVEEVRPGIWSIPVPFPDPATRYTLCYLIRSEGVSALIDPGMDTRQGWMHLQKGLDAAGVSPADIDGILVTHFHPDHLGLAARLRALSGAWLGLGADEKHYRPAQDLPAVVRENEEQLTLWGIPADRRKQMAFTQDTYSLLKNLALADVDLRDGDIIPVGAVRLRVVMTPGHSPGHVCFLDEERRLFFSGDHLLPGIRPHVLLDRIGLEDPLGSHLQSLDRASLSADYEVLPAHQYRFTGAATRAGDLRQWHERRSAEVLQLMNSSDPQDLWSVASRLAWRRGWDAMDPGSVRIALGETASHLAHLKRSAVPVPSI